VHVAPHPDHPHREGIKHPDGFTLPLSSWSNDFYYDWLAERHAILPESQASPWLFVTLPGSPRKPPGQALSTSAVRAMMNRLCDDVGIPRRHPHQLRHRVGERAVELGIAPEVLQELRGDRSITSQCDYRRASPESKVDGLQALEAGLPDMEEL
jgi:integrase